MSKVGGTYRNGHVELNESVDWPDGHQVMITDRELEDELLNEADWPDTPENRAELLRRLDQIEPLALAAEEEARIAAALAESKRANVEAVRRQMEQN